MSDYLIFKKTKTEMRICCRDCDIVSTNYDKTINCSDSITCTLDSDHCYKQIDIDQFKKEIMNQQEYEPNVI